MKSILSIILLCQSAYADERIAFACKHFADVAMIGYQVKNNYQTQEEFYKAISKQKSLTYKSLEIGYLANEKESAFTDAFSNCINWKE